MDPYQSWIETAPCNDNVPDFHTQECDIDENLISEFFEGPVFGITPSPNVKADVLLPELQPSDVHAAPSQATQQLPEVDLPLTVNDISLDATSNDEIGLFDCEWSDCGLVFTNKGSFVKHVSDFHVKFSKQHSCEWRSCDRKEPFLSKHDLSLHVRRHTGERPNVCHFPGCGKTYTRLENLKTHVRTHTGERPFRCKYTGCNKAFTNASDCAKHQTRTHSDTKPYRCCIDGCNKAYTDPSSLRKHIKRHHGDDAYENLKKNKLPYRRKRGLKSIENTENTSLEMPSPICFPQKPVLGEILNFSQDSLASSTGSPCTCNSARYDNGFNQENFPNLYSSQQNIPVTQPVFPFPGYQNSFISSDDCSQPTNSVRWCSPNNYGHFAPSEYDYSVNYYQNQYYPEQYRTESPCFPFY